MSDIYISEERSMDRWILPSWLTLVAVNGILSVLSQDWWTLGAWASCALALIGWMFEEQKR